MLTTNTQASGRYHSNWLNMMYPRLRLARQLLRDDGVIFVSIDDNEAHNLRALMDEVFGVENFVAQAIWQKVYSPRMDAKGMSTDHDYVLIYGYSEEFSPSRMPFEQNVKQFTGHDDKTAQKYRPRSLRKEGKNSRRVDRPNLYYPLSAPDGTAVYPIRSDGSEGCWRWSWAKYESASRQGLVEWVNSSTGWQVYVKQWYDEDATRPYSTIWPHTEVGHNHEAVENLRNAIGEPVFQNPKPVRLLRRILQVGSEEVDENIILDFFAGSCTTAQAVLDLNREDGGNRRFIMVQLPEPTPPESAARQAGFSTIAEIGKGRIRRVIQRMQGESQAKLIPERETLEDLGFRVFKLDRSHFKAWQDYEGEDVAQLETLFDRFESPLVEGWRPEDLLVEVMLMQGFPLDSSVTSLESVPHNRVLRVASDLVAHELYVCLDERLHPDTAEALELRPEDVLVCLDSALDEETKLRLQDGRNVMVI